MSGGFWMQCPLELVKHLPAAKGQVWFETSAEPSGADFGYAEADRTWKVVFLPRGGQNNAGFSGGWRSFAIDQVKLCCVLRSSRANLLQEDDADVLFTF